MLQNLPEERSGGLRGAVHLGDVDHRQFREYFEMR
jgi:hypothetical protein